MLMRCLVADKLKWIYLLRWFESLTALQVKHCFFHSVLAGLVVNYQ